MKKLLILILALVMCLSVLTSCDQIKGIIDGIIGGEQPGEIEYHIDRAEAFLKNMYKNENSVTAADYDVVGQVRVAGVPYAVTWAVDTDKVTIEGPNTDKDGNVIYKVNVDEKSDEEVAYKLTATITAGNGDTATVTFDRVVPKYNVLSWDEYMAAAKGDTVLVEGIVVEMNAKSLGNSRNHLFLMDASGKGGYYVYQMDQDPAEAGVKIGMTVSVSGPIEPYSGMQEIKGGTFAIVDETIKEVAPIDITDLVVAGTVNYGEYVALPVTIKGVTLGSQDMTKDSSQYLYFTLPDAKGTQAYVRTYVTDFPTTLSKAPTAENADKAAIDALHKEHFGDKADVTGILILYSGNPYLIPMSVDCFTNFVTVELTDADKIAAEVEGVSVVEGIFADTVIDLPTVGQYFDDVTISWTSDNAAAVVGADGKLTVTLGEDAVTVTLTAVYTCGETTETKTYVIEVAAIVKTFNQVVDTPVVGEEYSLMMHHTGLNKDLFVTGAMDGYYYGTTELAIDAAKVKVVDAGEGAYYLMVGEKYATIIKNGTYINAVYVDEAPEGKFTWNAEHKTFVINIDGTDYIYGTKASGTYKTVSPRKLEEVADTAVLNLVLVKMSTDGEIKMTADNMGLGDYAAGSVAVEGFTMGYTELGNYGNGIQMRIKEGRAASLWNETEFSFPIKQIVLVYNSEKSTYDNVGAFKFTFGNVMGGADYTVTLDTVKGTKTYTITPDAETYTYFKMELLLSYSFYWDSITVVLTDGNIVHEHEYTSEVVAPTCEDKGYTLHTCACGESYKDTSVNALGHNFVDGVCTTCELALVNITVADAANTAKGTWVVVTGTVIRIDTAWSEQYKNISVTIADGDSTLYLYRLATNVAVGDTITVTGKLDEYNGAKQIAAGATAVKAEHVHSYSDVTVAATCTTNGSVTPTCACGAVDEENVRVLPMAHTLDENKLCSVCDKYVLESSSLVAVPDKNTMTDGQLIELGYFTIICSKNYRADASEKEFADGYASAQRLNLGGKAALNKNSVKFTTDGAATITVWWVHGGKGPEETGSSIAYRNLVIYDADKNIVAQTNGQYGKYEVRIDTFEISAAGTYYLGGLEDNNYIYKVEVAPKAEETPVVAETVTYNFATTSTKKGEKLTNETALALFTASGSADVLTSVTVENMYDGNGDGGAYPQTSGFVKAGKSKGDGKLVLDFGDKKVAKVEIKCHDWYTKSDAYPTNSNTVSVNGSAEVLAPYNTEGTPEVMTFTVDNASVITIVTNDRVFIFDIVITFAE